MTGPPQANASERSLLDTCTCRSSQTNKAMISPLPVAVQLRTALQEAKVGFALWKSNKYIDEALAGKTDLDMLVNRKDEAAFE
ncbi:MAG: hypothetical protein K8F90_09580, partial [Hyphomicrobiales bacterium]|nr:hypothetical protein [Hyphomicrobiales bacterium]